MNTSLLEYKNQLAIFPSLICSDLCNLETSVKALERLKYKTLHLDIIDGYFSPSMPLGMEIIHKLRKKTNMAFDAHLMVKEPDFFLNELLSVPVDQLCFHVETSFHSDMYLNRIREKGTRAGLALTPGTPLSSLEYLAKKCDFILLMLINPGFAGYKSERQVPYALQKIRDLRAFLDKKGLSIPIEVDGRISCEDIPTFFEAGANIFVAGTTCLFKDGDIIEGTKNIRKIIKNINYN